MVGVKPERIAAHVGLARVSSAASADVAKKIQHVGRQRARAAPRGPTPLAPGCY